MHADRRRHQWRIQDFWKGAGRDGEWQKATMGCGVWGGGVPSPWGWGLGGAVPLPGNFAFEIAHFSVF